MEVVRRVDGALDLKSLHDLDHHGGGKGPGSGTICCCVPCRGPTCVVGQKQSKLLWLTDLSDHAGAPLYCARGDSSMQDPTAVKEPQHSDRLTLPR